MTLLKSIKALVGNNDFAEKIKGRGLAQANFIVLNNKSKVVANRAGACHSSANLVNDRRAVFTYHALQKDYSQETASIFWDQALAREGFKKYLYTQTYEDMRADSGILFSTDAPNPIYLMLSQLSRVSTSEWSQSYYATLRILEHYPDLDPLVLLWYAASCKLRIDNGTVAALVGSGTPLSTATSHFPFPLKAPTTQISRAYEIIALYLDDPAVFKNSPTGGFAAVNTTLSNLASRVPSEETPHKCLFTKEVVKLENSIQLEEKLSSFPLSLTRFNQQLKTLSPSSPSRKTTYWFDIHNYALIARGIQNG